MTDFLITGAYVALGLSVWAVLAMVRAIRNWLWWRAEEKRNPGFVQRLVDDIRHRQSLEAQAWRREQAKREGQR